MSDPGRPHAIRALLDDDVPTVAVSFADDASDEEIASAAADGVDVAELRIDRYASVDVDRVVAEARRFAALPTLATIRSRAEGGDWAGTDAERAARYEALLDVVDAIDVEVASVAASPELAAVVAAARARGVVVVLSHHDFDATPDTDELDALAARGRSLGADYVKVATMATSVADVGRLAAFTSRHAADGVIVIAMGPHGSQSRVFFPALGSRLTYAHLGRWAVPGQLTFAETFDLLRRFSPEFAERKAGLPPAGGPA